MQQSSGGTVFVFFWYNRFDSLTKGAQMSAKVVGLFGSYEPVHSEPNPKLIEELERLLEAARAGEIVGLTGAYLHREHAVSYSYAGAIGTFGMLGALDCLSERVRHIVMSRD